MAVAQNLNLGRSIRRNGPEIAGGAVGVGAPVLLRETADVQDGQEFSLVSGQGDLAARLTRPSVAWGLGVGGLTGVLWALDVGPNALRDFYLTHTLTGLVSGAASAAMPRSAGGGGGGQTARTRAARAGRTNGQTNEFSPADGSTPETRPAQ